MRMCLAVFFFFFSSRRRHTRCSRDWSSDVCSSDLESFERPLTHLAHDQAKQEFLLVGRPPREQLTEEALLHMGGALAGGRREALQRGVHRGELEGRSGGLLLGLGGLEGGVADPDPSLAERARQEGDRDLDLVRTGPLQEGGDEVDLRKPAARCRDATRGLDEVMEQQVVLTRSALEDDIAARIGAAQPLEALAGLLQSPLALGVIDGGARPVGIAGGVEPYARSEEHTSELQSRLHLVCRLLLEKKKRK